MPDRANRWLRFALLAALAAGVAARTAAQYRFLAEAPARGLGLPLAAYFPDGLVDTVAWLRASGANRVRGVAGAHGPLVSQRLAEMLYPLRYEEVAAGGLRPGDLLVLPAGAPSPRPAQPLFCAGGLRVVSVTE
jgi:hypothetical protein